jgi:hypothetical protein
MGTASKGCGGLRQFMYALTLSEARKFSGMEGQASQPCLDIAFESTNIRLSLQGDGLG